MIKKKPPRMLRTPRTAFW